MYHATVSTQLVPQHAVPAPRTAAPALPAQIAAAATAAHQLPTFAARPQGWRLLLVLSIAAPPPLHQEEKEHAVMLPHTAALKGMEPMNAMISTRGSQKIPPAMWMRIAPAESASTAVHSAITYAAHAAISMAIAAALRNAVPATRPKVLAGQPASAANARTAAMATAHAFRAWL